MSAIVPIRRTSQCAKKYTYKRESGSSLSTDQIHFPKCCFFFSLGLRGGLNVISLSCNLIEENGGFGGRLFNAAVLAEFIYYNKLNEINHFFILTDTRARIFCFKNCCKIPNKMAMTQVVI